MYVCVCVYRYIYRYLCTHTYLHMYTHIYIDTYVQIHVYTCKDAYTQILITYWTAQRAPRHRHADSIMLICVYIYMNISTYISH